jgi:hypothetical protein
MTLDSFLSEHFRLNKDGASDTALDALEYMVFEALQQWKHMLPAADMVAVPDQHTVDAERLVGPTIDGQAAATMSEAQVRALRTGAEAPGTRPGFSTGVHPVLDPAAAAGVRAAQVQRLQLLQARGQATREVAALEAKVAALRGQMGGPVSGLPVKPEPQQQQQQQQRSAWTIDLLTDSDDDVVIVKPEPQQQQQQQQQPVAEHPVSAEPSTEFEVDLTMSSDDDDDAPGPSVPAAESMPMANGLAAAIKREQPLPAATVNRADTLPPVSTAPGIQGEPGTPASLQPAMARLGYAAANQQLHAARSKVAQLEARLAELDGQLAVGRTGPNGHGASIARRTASVSRCIHWLRARAWDLHQRIYCY